MNEKFAPAIEVLKEEIADHERQARELKKLVNALAKKAGAPELYANVEADESTASIGSIQADTFYGKVIGTAAREYLEMRKAANLGPATPREIYDALIQGGFQFDTKNEQVALVSLRSTLRKNSRMFHKLPNGGYGLLSWYPNAKPPKAGSDDEEDDTKAAANTKSAADSSSETPVNHDEEGVSEPQQEEA
jgi:hypothetical protein